MVSCSCRLIALPWGSQGAALGGGGEEEKDYSIFASRLRLWDSNSLSCGEQVQYDPPPPLLPSLPFKENMHIGRCW